MLKYTKHIILFLSILSLAISQKIEVKDKDGNKYILNPDKTWEQNNSKTTNNNKNNQSSEIQAFLKVHNDERKRLGIPLLEWDESIANSCLEYANHLLKINQLQHAETEYGENLFGGYSSDPNQYNLKDAALAWLSEKKLFKENKYTYQCGHYTQMIWRNTQKVGAAIVSENGKCYVVARYFPPGNYINQKVY